MARLTQGDHGAETRTELIAVRNTWQKQKEKLGKWCVPPRNREIIIIIKSIFFKSHSVTRSSPSPRRLSLTRIQSVLINQRLLTTETVLSHRQPADSDTFHPGCFRLPV